MTAVATLATRATGRRAVLGGTALAAVVEVLPGPPTALLTLAGLWLLLGAPTVLWYGIAARVVSTRDGRVLLAVGLSVITDIVVALVVNTALPTVGIGQPLARAPLAVASALAVVVIALAVDPPSERLADSFARWREGHAHDLPPGLVAVSAVGTVTLALSVAGPIRLNNQSGSAVSVAAMVAVALLLALLMWRHRHYAAPVVVLGLFFAAAGLLLLTSLRGWYITGHDIQHEFEVFQLTATGNHWNISSYRDTYNACMSITLLPTSQARLTGISGVYVFKVVLPLLFALTPALVYRSVRNVAPSLVALLSAVFLMMFPTFFTDMVFMARQEVAFLLLGCAMVVLTETGRPVASRRVAFTVLALGIVLSHYSTTYIIVVTLALAFVTDLVWRLCSRLRRRTPPETVQQSFVTWWIIAATAVAAVVWTGPVSHTGGQLETSVTTTVRDLRSGQAWNRSSDVSYSLIGGAQVSPAQRLREYRADIVRQREGAGAGGDYLPLSVADASPLRPEPEQVQPLTPVGRALQDSGVDVVAANSGFRAITAMLLQLLLFVGVVTTLWGRRKAFRPTRDQVTLTVGAGAVIAMLTLLPQASIDYGVLRSFQQGLFVFGPFIAAGLVWICRWAGRRRAAPLACALSLVLFLDLVGALPKLFGGYPPVLNLDNAGQYYDNYYIHPEERTAFTWLLTRAPGQQVNIQPQDQTDRVAFRRLQTQLGTHVLNGIHPLLIKKDSYVFLGTTTVRKGEAAVYYRGDGVPYRYPAAFLDATKNKVYSSDGAEIFR
ncbi:DUF2206 domain-containing protein [Streptomyces griseorubiginosus]|uniref:DUF2206 domain-containing protein n=1 Tax=Streptomyces griseorubiginosus TaxID=67304 RepID=UPI0033ACB3D4